MPANFVEGFMTRQPAWHGLGTVIPDYLDLGRPEELERAIILAGHDRQVNEVPIFRRHETRNEYGAIIDVQMIQVEGYKGIWDPRAGKMHQVAGDGYQVVQFQALWELLEALREEANKSGDTGLGGLKIESAGVLKDGAVGWILAHFEQPLDIPGDPSPVAQYFSLDTSHDGSAATRVMAHDVRIVCMNTARLAESTSKWQVRATKDQQQGWTFRHTKNVHERIDQAKTAMQRVRASGEAFRVIAMELAALPVTGDQRELFVSTLIPSPPGNVISDRVARNIEEARAAVRGILNGPTCDGIRDNAYGLVQAGVEYLQHVRKFRNRETYFSRSILSPDAQQMNLVPMVREIQAAEVSRADAVAAGALPVPVN